MIVESAYGTGVWRRVPRGRPARSPIVTLIAVSVVFLPNRAARHPDTRSSARRVGPQARRRARARRHDSADDCRLPADVEDELTRELEDAEDAAIDAAAASVAMAPVGLAHDPSTSSVETVGAGSGANRDAGSRAE